MGGKTNHIILNKQHQASEMIFLSDRLMDITRVMGYITGETMMCQTFPLTKDKITIFSHSYKMFIIMIILRGLFTVSQNPGVWVTLSLMSAKTEIILTITRDIITTDRDGTTPTDSLALTVRVIKETSIQDFRTEINFHPVPVHLPISPVLTIHRHPPGRVPCRHPRS